jgi:hypothetical protein
MTDYKQLCAELLRAMDEIEECEAVDWSLVKTKPLKMANQAMAEARTALDEPEPEKPTDEELDELFTEIDQSGEPESWRAYARAVLARWGNHPESPDSSPHFSFS